MYDPDKKCGVLSDFDLSLLQWEPRVIGTDRTGTVPFMAIDLLSQDYWDGKIQRFYHHEMESFIWILAYVVLLYDMGVCKKNPEVDAWRTSSYVICQEKKLRFYTKGTLTKAKGGVQPSYQDYWPLVNTLCGELRFCHVNNDRRPVDRDAPFKASEELWNAFILALQSIADLSHLLPRLRLHKPSFSIPDPAKLEQFRQEYGVNRAS